MDNDAGSLDRVKWFGTIEPKARRKEPTTLIIGCDFHAGFQQVAVLDRKTGEVRELCLGHREAAERFYAGLRGPVRVGIEACGYSQ